MFGLRSMLVQGTLLLALLPSVALAEGETKTATASVQRDADQAFDALKAEEAKRAAEKAATPESEASEPKAPEGTEGAKPAGEGAKADAVKPADVKPVSEVKAEEVKAAATSTRAAATVATTGTPLAEDATKPWKLIGKLTTSLGEGTFVKDAKAAAPSFSYAVALTGSYKVTDLISLTAFMTFDQVLTVSNLDVGTVPREFFFRDILISASAPELFTERFTGIKLGAAAGFSLPTSKLSQAQEIVTALRAGLTLTRAFEGVGPGTLTLAYSLGYRHIVGPEARALSASESPTIVETCRSSSRDSNGDCLTSFANTRDGLQNTGIVTYEFLDDFAFAVSLALKSSFGAALGESAPPSSLPVGRSPYATGTSNVTAVTVAAVELGYNINKYLSAAVGLSTEQEPYIQSGSNSRRLRFPFWDFESQANSLSSFYLSLAATY